MADQVFVVVQDKATPLNGISLKDAGLKERQHLQEWVRLNPSVLGDGVIVVTFEFDKWADGSGAHVDDRLDVLGIDRTGRLVVVELKRDVAADATDMQAIKYAAMASQFTLKTLAQHHAKYLSKMDGVTVSEVDAMNALRKHIDDYESSDVDPLFERPRIVLMAREFPSNVTATVVFLSGYGVDITLLRFQAYETPNKEHVVVLSRFFPIQEIEALRVAPRALEEVAEKKSIEARQQRAVFRIIERDALPEGSELTLVPPAAWAGRLSEIVEAEPNNGKATWDPANNARPLRWKVDGLNYSPSGLCGKIITEAGYDPPTYQYTTWWQVAGKTLVDIARELKPL